MSCWQKLAMESFASGEEKFMLTGNFSWSGQICHGMKKLAHPLVGYGIRYHFLYSSCSRSAGGIWMNAPPLCHEADVVMQLHVLPHETIC